MNALRLLVLIIAIGAAAAPSNAATSVNFCQLSLSTPASFSAEDLERHIRDSGLSAQNLETLRTRSLGFISISELMSETNQNGYLLGIQGPDDLLDLIAAHTGLTAWSTAYRSFGIDFGERNHTQKFMETLTRTNKRIVFMVPAKLWLHPAGVHTKREIWWLLANPDRLQNVQFVFGTIEAASR